MEAISDSVDLSLIFGDIVRPCIHVYHYPLGCLRDNARQAEDG